MLPKRLRIHIARLAAHDAMPVVDCRLGGDGAIDGLPWWLDFTSSDNHNCLLVRCLRGIAESGTNDENRWDIQLFATVRVAFCRRMQWSLTIHLQGDGDEVRCRCHRQLRGAARFGPGQEQHKPSLGGQRQRHLHCGLHGKQPNEARSSAGREFDTTRQDPHHPRRLRLHHSPSDALRHVPLFVDPGNPEQKYDLSRPRSARRSLISINSSAEARGNEYRVSGDRSLECHELPSGNTRRLPICQGSPASSRSLRNGCTQ
jgi:hypothetical protein